MNKIYGLIGYPLSHSFSKKYFTEKFEKEGIVNCRYELFPIADAKDFLSLFEQNRELQGLNVTIPHKVSVIPFLHSLDDSAVKVGAVNVIKRSGEGDLIGYNSDYYGFKASLIPFMEGNFNKKALILGKGGAAKAVEAALKDLSMVYKYVSRQESESSITYNQLNEQVMNEYQLIINTTPLGMYPAVDEAPALPYDFITPNHYFYDLVYNPPITKMMQLAQNKQAKAKNGLDMLYLQAEKAWEIWNS